MKQLTQHNNYYVVYNEETEMYDLYHTTAILHDSMYVGAELQLLARDIPQALISRIIYELTRDQPVDSMKKAYG